MIWYWLGMTVGDAIWCAILPHNWINALAAWFWQGATLIGWWIVSHRRVTASVVPEPHDDASAGASPAGAEKLTP